MQLKDAIGRYGEAVAVQVIHDAGFRLIETNWRCREGEIDIIAADGRTLVVCEVKTRSSVAFGDPSEAVSRVKASRLRMLATRWLADHASSHESSSGNPDSGNPSSRNPDHWDAIRFDVISVLRPRQGPARVRHVRGAF